MIKNVSILFRYFIYWYLLFVASRVVFIFLNWSELHTVSIGEIAYSFYHGFRLDVSMTFYCSFFPFILWILSHFYHKQTHLNKILKTYNAILLAILVLITVADGELYFFWGQKLNAYASSFAKFPKEMLVFSSGVGTFKLIAIALGFFAFAYGIYHYGMTGLNEVRKDVKLRWLLLSSLFILFIMVIGLRGGIGKSSLNQSSAFYSNNTILNHVALNTAWNLMSSFIETSENTQTNPFVFTDTNEAKTLINKLNFTPKGFPYLFQKAQPNLVFIILEGWSGDVVGAVGGEKNVTPYFNKLCEEGYLFDNFYATGNRTDKGLASIISAQPALPNSSIINNIQKFSHLPSVAHALKQKGYSTSFYYGGESDFANMKAYWLTAGYKDIIDLAQFQLSQHNADWGVHDDVLWQKVLQELGTKKSPFFASVLTLSSHEPFNVPEKNAVFSDDEGSRYRNAVWYADKQLGLFFEAAKKQSWYNETIFVIQSDHGHKLPMYRRPMQAGMYHIPMLIVGGALKKEYRGYINHNATSQVNTAAIVLPQLGINTKEFNWSYNSLDSGYIPFAAFIYHHGVGMVNNHAKAVYSNFNKMIEWSQGDSAYFPILEKQARSYLQLYYDEYLLR